LNQQEKKEKRNEKGREMKRKRKEIIDNEICYAKYKTK